MINSTITLDISKIFVQIKTSKIFYMEIKFVNFKNELSNLRKIILLIAKLNKYIFLMNKIVSGQLQALHNI